MRSFALASGTLCFREWTRFLRDRARALSSIVTALLFWALIGFGLAGSFVPAGMPQRMGAVEYLFPGTIVFVVLLTAIVGTFSLIEDRREGFLQGVIVAPVPRSAIVLGKVLGGATIALVQGIVLLPIAPLVGIPLQAVGLVQAIGALFLIALGFNALGFVLAWRMESIQGFHGIVNLILMPLWFLSGALFPIAGAARGLEVAMRANPVTYGLAAFRDSLYRSGGAGPVGWSSAWLVTIAFALVTFGLAVTTARR